MSETIGCACGQIQLEVTGKPIFSCECANVQSSRSHSLRFMLKLGGAWAKMVFRAPSVAYVEGGTL